MGFSDLMAEFGVAGVVIVGGSDQAVKSKDALLAIYEALDQDAKFKATNDAFIASKCGTEGDVALAQAQNRSKEFREAAQLFEDKKYSEAATAFYRFYKTAPADDPNRPKRRENMLGAIVIEQLVDGPHLAEGVGVLRVLEGNREHFLEHAFAGTLGAAC